MSKKIKDIKKLINKEAKYISDRFASKIAKNSLSIKLTPRDLRNALQFSKTENKPIARFTKDYISQLAAFLEYIADENQNIEVIFDEKCDKAYIEKFKIAWNEYFALKIYSKGQDMKEIKRKSGLSIAFGVLCLLVVIGFGIGALYCDNMAFKISSIVIDSVFSILSWVLIWEFFYDVIYTLPNERKKIIALYNMYKVKM